MSGRSCDYSPGEERLNVLTHAAGAVLALGGMALVPFVVPEHGVRRVAAFAVYLLALFGMYLASSCYHAARTPERKALLRRFDHAAIYLLIAGTYTPVMLLAAAMLTIFYLTGHGISRIHGAIFFAAIILYTAWSVRQAKREAAVNTAVVEEARKSVSSGNAGAMRLPAAVLLTIAGLALLILGAKLFLAGSVFFARRLQVSDAMIGLPLVAVGTNLTEQSTSVVAAVRGEKDIAIGNVVGSNIFNVFAILGIAPLISPLRNATLSYVDLGVMLLCSVLLLPIMRTGWKISRLEGVFLLLIYIAYTAWLIMQSAL